MVAPNRRLSPMPRLACLIAALLLGQVSCFQFYLHSGERRCFTDSAAPSTKILGEYTVSTGKGHMSVDITVRMENKHTSLYSRKNVDHGKFAFVLPYDDSQTLHVHEAEMHRKASEHHHHVHSRAGRVHSAHADQADDHHRNQRRRLLSVDDHVHEHYGHDDGHGRYGHEDYSHGHQAHDDYSHNRHAHGDYHHEHGIHEDAKHHAHEQDDLHLEHHTGHEMKLDSHEHHEEHHDVHMDNDRQFDHHYDHNDHHREGHDHDHPEHPDEHHGRNHDHEHGDEDDYDYDDDLDDFDADEYDGIGDDELDEEEERMEQAELKKHGRFEDASDEDKEERLFDEKKFEICVVNEGDKSSGFKRRVRLVIHKGATAHDYTRLAKKEHMSQLEVSLRQVSGELHELMTELDQARRMEDILRQLNENTNKRVVLFSVLSLLSLFAVGGYQAFYTKRFFKRKKIL